MLAGQMTNETTNLGMDPELADVKTNLCSFCSFREKQVGGRAKSQKCLPGKVFWSSKLAFLAMPRPVPACILPKKENEHTFTSLILFTSSPTLHFHDVVMVLDMDD